MISQHNSWVKARIGCYKKNSEFSKTRSSHFSISTSLQNHTWIRQFFTPCREDLHRAGFEFGYLGLRVEGVDGQQVGSGFGEAPRDDLFLSKQGHNKIQDELVPGCRHG